MFGEVVSGKLCWGSSVGEVVLEKLCFGKLLLGKQPNTQFSVLDTLNNVQPAN